MGSGRDGIWSGRNLAAADSVGAEPTGWTRPMGSGRDGIWSGRNLAAADSVGAEPTGRT